MTEEQAKTKWCPMVRAHENTALPRPLRAAGPESVPLERNPPECRCIASDCMMWRYTNACYGDDGKLYVNASLAYGDKPDGYCGLVKR